MGLPIIGNFDISKFAPLDTRLEAADESSRLNIKWAHTLMRVRQLDDNGIYEYKGGTLNPTAPYTNSADWTKVLTWISGVVNPVDATDGVDGDFFLNEVSGGVYKKGSGVWAFLFNISGANILTDNADPQDANGADGDLFIQTANGTTYLAGDVFSKISGSWGSSLMNINGAAGAAGDKYATTTDTNIDFDGPLDPLTVVVDTGLAWTAGQSVRISLQSDPNVNFITGNVKSYSIANLTIENTVYTGTGSQSGTFGVNLDGAAGRAGKGFQFTETGIVLTQAKITSVEAGSYDLIDPYIANVSVDSRSTAEKSATGGIVGSMDGYLVIWDGGASAGGIGWKSARLLSATPPTVVARLGVVTNGSKRVHQVQSFAIGGTTYQNDLNKYLGASGLVTDINAAVDVRGAAGADGDDASGITGTALYGAQSWKQAYFFGSVGTEINPLNSVNGDISSSNVLYNNLFGSYYFGQYVNNEVVPQYVTINALTLWKVNGNWPYAIVRLRLWSTSQSEVNKTIANIVLNTPNSYYSHFPLRFTAINFQAETVKVYLTFQGFSSSGVLLPNRALDTMGEIPFYTEIMTQKDA